MIFSSFIFAPSFTLTFLTFPDGLDFCLVRGPHLFFAPLCHSRTVLNDPNIHLRLVWFLLLTLFLHSVDLVDSATWLIVDGPAPKAQHGGSGRMVVLSSPNDDNFHEFGKAV